MQLLPWILACAAPDDGKADSAPVDTGDSVDSATDESDSGDSDSDSGDSDSDSGDSDSDSGDSDSDSGDSDSDSGDSDSDSGDSDSDSGDSDSGEVDADGDGFGADDCDDADPEVHPGAAERCDDRDEDCDGAIDEDAGDAVVFYEDGDGDGFGAAELWACEAPPGAVELGGDCDDGEAGVFPGAEEHCDDRDEDCDGDVDEDPVDGVEAWTDDDGDGWGAGSASTSCSLGEGWAAAAGDCDDGDAGIGPGAAETCGDGVDQDCDGLDEGDEDCAPSAEVTADLYAWGDGEGAGAGGAIAIADFDADGAAELVLGMPGSDAVLVHRGPLGADPSLSSSDASARLGGSGGTYGSALAVGDFDGDGLPELAVGDPGAGTVEVWTGAELLAGGAASWIFSGEGDFGSSLSFVAAGDGSARLAVGAPSAALVHTDAGVVWIFEAGETDAVAALFGEAESDSAGAVLSAGDLDGDGEDELVVAAPGRDGNGADAGRIHVLSGPWSGQIALGTRGAWIDGDAAGDGLGGAVAVAGDLDADGYADLVVGSASDDGAASGAGAVGLWFGPIPPSRQHFSDADHHLLGLAASDRAGSSVGPAGDLDADGRADLLVGVPGHGSSTDEEGEAVVLYGLPEATDLSGDASLAGSAGAPLGSGAIAAGDVDGDGYDDVAVASPEATVSGWAGAGYVRVVLGGSRGGEVVVALAPDPADDADGDGQAEVDGDCDDTRATAFTGGVERCDSRIDEDCDGFDNRCAPAGEVDLEATGSDLSGAIAVRSLGDVNGDGWVDLGALLEDDSDIGSVAVLLGPFPDRALDLSAEVDATWTGDAAYDGFGSAFGALGDFDGDGLDDFFVLSTGNDDGGSGAGKVVIVSGDPAPGGSATSDAADVQILGSGSLPAIQGAHAVGDLDGDGLADLLVTTNEWADAPYVAGSAYVFFGGRTGVLGIEDADVKLRGEHYHDYPGSLAAGCDLDGDGQQDLVVGSSSNAEQGGGKLWVLHGPLAAGLEMELQGADAMLTREAESSYIQHSQSLACADLTADGYADLAWFGAGAEVHVVHGPLGPTRHRLPEDADAVLSGDDPADATAYDTIGGAGAVGDIDGDGYADLLVATPYDAWSEGGKAYVAWGPIDHDETLGDGGWMLSGEAGTVTGGQVEVVDLDGDPQADLVVVATGEAFAALVHGGVDPGRLPITPHVVGEADDQDGDGVSVGAGDCDDTDPAVHPGATEVCESLADEDCDGLDPWCPPADGEIASPRTSFSATNGIEGVAVLDADGDGVDDLLFGDDYKNEAYLVFGPFVGGEIDLTVEADWTFTAPSSFSDLGRDVASAGDVDGDGDDDLLVGDGEYPEAWLVLSDPGLGEQKVETVAAVTFNGSTRYDGMGYAVVGVGDTDGDGILEVAVSEWESGGSKTGLGLWEVGGSEGEVDFSTVKASIYSSSSGDAAGEFGEVGDLDGDGLDDLGFNQGSSDYSAHAGSVYLFYGDSLDGSLYLSDADVILSPESSAAAADTIHAVGDLDGDGAVELAVGAPYTDSDSYASAGRAYVFYGAPARGTSASLDSADLILHGIGTYARVGTGVAGLDLDADGAQDLAVMGMGYPTVTGALGGMFWLWGPVTLSGVEAVEDVADARVHDEDGGGGSVMLPMGDTDGDGWPELYNSVSAPNLFFGGPR